MSNPNHFTVFEHHSLVQGRVYGNNEFTEKHLQILENFYKEKDFPYYTLIRKGVRFCQYVGVLQSENLTVEILPKADKNTQNSDNEQIVWRKMLIDMLRSVGIFNIRAPSFADLTLKPNAILDLYFEYFITETESLLHKGLIKRYRKTEGNSTALKGSLQFAKHIQQNLTHQERFYVRYTTYDREHPLNCLLYKTLRLLKKINTNANLSSRIGALLLNFPELPDVKADEAWFDKLQFDRKTEPYEKAASIAKLLILNYHPDLSTGKNDVLALMFDMNALWEKFVFQSLRKYKPDNGNYIIQAQTQKVFWKRNGSNRSKKIMKPDIVIENDGQMVVLDTKWKNIGDENPADNDLRQMYAYSRFHNNAKTALVYPGDNKNDFIVGNFDDDVKAICGIMTLAVEEKNVTIWQKAIADYIFGSTLFPKNLTS
jgi:5-methylcytosine-specific restriction enzyme subunit McrC